MQLVKFHGRAPRPMLLERTAIGPPDINREAVR
jgi:hypothetical protein